MCTQCQACCWCMQRNTHQGSMFLSDLLTRTCRQARSPVDSSQLAFVFRFPAVEGFGMPLRPAAFSASKREIFARGWAPIEAGQALRADEPEYPRQVGIVGTAGTTINKYNRSRSRLGSPARSLLWLKGYPPMRARVKQSYHIHVQSDCLAQ